LITQKIVCDTCGQEMKEHVYFAFASAELFLTTMQYPNVPDESAPIQHACGDRCLMNMLSEWMMNRKKRETNGNHDTARSGK
jgi:hypothetical protein